MSIESLPPCTWPFAENPADVLRGLIGSLEEELATMPHSPFHAEKFAARVRGLTLYRRALQRLTDAAASEGRRP
jgi:hypothetical protein